MNSTMEKQKQTNKGIKILIWILIATLVISSGLYFYLENNKSVLFGSKKNKTEELVVFDNIAQDTNAKAEEDKNLLDVSNVDLGEVASDSLDDLISTRNVEMDPDKVLVNVKTGGRRNPFMPYVERNISPDGAFDLMEPPEYVPDEVQAEDLMKTTVSGIMYDSEKPCAILNVDGVDQLVSKGDRVAEFNIVNITKNKVFVKKGANVIAAEVGEALEAPNMNYNRVYNLEKKFGGKYQPRKKGVIVINGQEY